MKRIISLLLTSMLLQACTLIAGSKPPPYIYEAWHKSGATKDLVKADMVECGYRDVMMANDLVKTETDKAEICMKRRGYTLDESRYLPGNCYGRGPYLCNKVWESVK